MRKIIISGATSMLGVALTEIAVRKGTEVYAIIRPDTNRKDRIVQSPLIHPIYGSLENLKAIDCLPADCDVFYHFAWAGTSKMTRDDPLIQEKNIQYALDAVNVAEKAGCRRFVGAGSQAEYGPVDGVIDEQTKHAPATAYGVAKYAAGILSRKLCEAKKMEHVWGRIFSVYGPHDNENTMLNYAISCFEKGETAHFSSSTQMWNYLYESDAGEMFYRVGQVYVPSGTYFVANTESKILKEYISEMMQVYGEKAKAEFASSGAEQVFGLNVNMDRTIKTLNYRPVVRFNNGISQMIGAIHKEK